MSTKVVEIKTLKVGKYIVLGGEACKIISYDKRLGQVISIQGDNVQIMDMENYDTIDLPMPEELKDDIVEGIEVEYIVALGNMKIMRTRGSA